MKPNTTVEPRKINAKKHFLLMMLLGGVILGVAIYANMWKENRRATEVVVDGNRILAAKDILTLATVPDNSLMFNLDLYAIEQRVRKNPYVKSVAVHRDIPNRIRISIEERVPVAAVVMDRLYYLDADGYVLPPARSQSIFDLPVLTGLPSGEFVSGVRTKNRDAFDALSILAVAREIDDELYRNISEIHFEENRDAVFYTAEFGIPVVLGREQVGINLVKFDSFWKSIVVKSGAQQLQYIDLRFEDQVVVRFSVLSEAKNLTSSVSKKAL